MDSIRCVLEISNGFFFLSVYPDYMGKCYTNEFDPMRFWNFRMGLKFLDFFGLSRLHKESHTNGFDPMRFGKFSVCPSYIGKFYTNGFNPTDFWIFFNVFAEQIVCWYFPWLITSTPDISIGAVLSSAYRNPQFVRTGL